jgi:hypothetical protein
MCFLAFMMSGLVGCCSYPGPAQAWPISITADPTLKGKSVEVDLVAVNAAEDPGWQSMPISDYFQANNQKRADAAKYMMHFGPGKPETQKFDPATPQWKELWKTWLGQGAVNMYIIANLPGDFSDKSGTSDPRRRILPLGKCAWQKNTPKEWQIRLRASGVEVETPPDPKPSK